MKALRAQHAEVTPLLGGSELELADTASAGGAGAPGAPGAGGTRLLGAEPVVAPFVRSDRKVGRNEPCPCGSGKKFKHCHGALAGTQ
jgi:preprotein translocase subunit SecA